MAAFRYALQSALERFENFERSAKQLFAERSTAFERERAASDAFERLAAAARDRLPLAAPAAAHVFAEIDGHHGSLAARRERQTERTAAAARELASARAELERATRRRCALERHRARRYEDYERTRDLREAAEFDDDNALAHARSKGFA